MKFYFPILIISMIILGGCQQENTTAVLASSAVSDNGGSHLLISFTGKGTNLGWDIGVIKALNEVIPKLDERKLFIMGNSSGAVSAAWYACWGMSEESTVALGEIMQDFIDRTKFAIPSNADVFKKLRSGKRTELDWALIDDLLERILNRNGKPCELHHPYMTTAGNLDILDKRIPREESTGAGGGTQSYVLDDQGEPVRDQYNEPVPRYKTFSGIINIKIIAADNKRMEMGNYDIIAKDDDSILGKACTYFASPQILSMMQNVPAKEQIDDNLWSYHHVHNRVESRAAVTTHEIIDAMKYSGQTNKSIYSSL